MSQLKSIILIDDDNTTNFLNKRIIEKLDVAEKILIFKNGLEALNYFKDLADPDYSKSSLIILDINMPVMNGFEFLEHYNGLSEDKKAKKLIVMLTTSAIESEKDLALKYRVSDFLSKPLTSEKIMKVITTYF